MEVIVVLFFLMHYDRRSGVLTANNNNVKLVETRTVHFACLELSNCFNRPQLLLLANFNTCFPPEIPSDIAFYPINPKASAKIAGIVKKFFCGEAGKGEG